MESSPRLLVVTPLLTSSKDLWYTRVGDGLLLRLDGQTVTAYGYYVDDRYKPLGETVANSTGISLATAEMVANEAVVTNLRGKMASKLIELWDLGPTFFLDTDNQLALERLPSGVLSLVGRWDGSMVGPPTVDDLKKGRSLGYFIPNEAPEVDLDDDDDDDEVDLEVEPFPQLGDNFYRDRHSSLIIEIVRTATIVGNWDGKALQPIPDSLRQRAKDLGIPVESLK